MDNDYLTRVTNRVQEFFDSRLQALFNTPKDASYPIVQAGHVESMRAAKYFVDILRSEINPPKPKEEKNESSASDVA